MSRYRGRHRGRHARPTQPPAVRALGVARRPAVTVGLALTLIGTGAVSVSPKNAEAEIEPTALDAPTSALVNAASQQAIADETRIAEQRATLNTRLSAQQGQVQAAAKAKADAIAKARREAAAKVARDKARTSAIARAQSDPRGAAKVLMGDYGFTGEGEWRCLNLLWEGESGWRHTAENPTSGAYGIPQSLPASKMATVGDDYRTNPITQIKWGLGYIKDRYGSPCGAWEFWNSKSPHWY